MPLPLSAYRTRTLGVAVACCAVLLPGAAGQAGDKAGEEQPALPANLTVPPAPALSPRAEAATFQVAAGLRVELVAAEPLVHDPVAIAFDGDGQLWVAEMRAYMPNVDGTGEQEPLGSVAVLVDTDGDGRMDQRTEFLEGLVLPRALAIAGDGLLVISPPDLLYCRDTDGDGRADERTVIDTNLGGIASPEHAINGLVYTLDGWYQCANSPVRYRQREGTWERARTGGGGQWGLSLDDYGRAFFNTNSDPLRADFYPSHYAVRNPNHGRASGTNVRILHDFSVFPSHITPGVNRGYRPGLLKDYRLVKYTGACAPHYYRGGRLGAEFKDTVFVCEPCANLVGQVRVNEQADGTLDAARAHPRREFLTSTDERFRPVNLADGPDGALYIVDMYRGLIQHRLFVTSFLRKQVIERGLESPIGLGRIWRVVPEGQRRPTPAALSEASWGELVELLSHENGWWRDTARRTLAEEGGGSRDAWLLLRRMAHGGPTALARIHAIWALAAMESIDRTCALAILDDPDPEVRLAAVRAAEGLCGGTTNPVVDKLVELAMEDAGRLRHQVLLSLGESGAPAARAALVELATGDVSSAALRSAILSGLQASELTFLMTLLADSAWQEPAPGRGKLLQYLARAIGREGRTTAISAVLERLATPPELVPWQGQALVDGLLEARTPGPAGKGSYLFVGEQPPALASLASTGENYKRLPELNSALAWPGRSGLDFPQVRPLSEDERPFFEHGRRIYGEACAACHQASGLGAEALAPPLRHSAWVLGDEGHLIRILRWGLVGPVEVRGQTWDLQMPALDRSDEEIAAVLTYIRREWGHGADPVTPAAVKETVEAVGQRTAAFTTQEL
ncbi:MAG: dehydrogenase [Planctomycetes bacterium]|nr:dehydrogenase [Planctomycetota bacterium]HJO27053.1 HEAT repeat domain-containing protein [Planctomycetota bacterium]